VKPIGLVFATVLAVLGAAAPARAQSRPLVTEDPETVPAGYVLLEGGLDFARSMEFRASGLKGHLWRLGVLGASVGVGPFAEIQFDGGLRQRLRVTEENPNAPLAPLLDITGDRTGDAIDVRVGTKLRILTEAEARPAVAARFWTRLPLADPESGLGAGTTDFSAGLALGKTVGSVRMVFNVGLGSAGNAIEGHRRHVIVDYGGSLARAVRPGVEVVGELAGLAVADDPGAPPASTTVRVGGRITHGPVRLDGAVSLGLNEDDPIWGLTAGATWVFRAFTAP
jgi:hypothetical protein